MLGFVQQMIEVERLMRLRKKLVPAKERGATRCVRCGYCCEVRTCIFNPDELAPAAKLLKLTVQKMLQTRFIVDYSSGRDSDILYPRPASINTEDLVGQIVPNDRTFGEGPCIFLDRSEKVRSCKIHRARPHAAKVMACWRDEEPKDVFLWKKGQLAGLLGYEPQKGRSDDDYDDGEPYD